MNERSPSATSLFQTDLAQTPLPEILLTIHRYKAPGVVECRRGDEVKRIFLDQGGIIFASSNQRHDSLGDKLLRDGLITREQYDESVRLLTLTGKRQGTILAEMKVIEPLTLFVSVRDQIQEIVWSIFGWESGQVTFSPGRDKHLEFVKLGISIPQAIMQGVRRIPEARALVARLGTKTTLLEQTGNKIDGLTIGLDEQRLLDTADGKRMLYELVNTPPLQPGENARILYALFALQLIAVRTSKQIKVQVKTRQ